MQNKIIFNWCTKKKYNFGNSLLGEQFTCTISKCTIVRVNLAYSWNMIWDIPNIFLIYIPDVKIHFLIKGPLDYLGRKWHYRHQIFIFIYYLRLFFVVRWEQARSLSNCSHTWIFLEFFVTIQRRKVKHSVIPVTQYRF